MQYKVEMKEPRILTLSLRTVDHHSINPKTLFKINLKPSKTIFAYLEPDLNVTHFTKFKMFNTKSI